MKNALIIGATSAIAKATARLWASRGCQLYLLARNEQRLGQLVADLEVRGATKVHAASFDCDELERHEELLAAAHSALGSIDVALIGYGTLGDQDKCTQDFAEALRQIQTNAISVLSIMTILANMMQPQQNGTIAVISSVAGDRGRQSNYVYGTAKATVSIFAQGLRHRLAKSGVHVVTIKPGFVDTPMTAEFNKGLLWAQPETIAKYIDTGISKRKDVVYAPWFWRYIMLIIRLIPESIFKKTSL